MYCGKGIVDSGTNKGTLVTARIMVVMEGVGDDGANVATATESFDYGHTWQSRTTAYAAKVDAGNGRRHNAYVPWGVKPNIPGPVRVCFCTDEAFPCAAAIPRWCSRPALLRIGRQQR